MIDNRDWGPASLDEKLNLLRTEIETISATIITANRAAALRHDEVVKGIGEIIGKIKVLSDQVAQTRKGKGAPRPT